MAREMGEVTTCCIGISTTSGPLGAGPAPEDDTVKSLYKTDLAFRHAKGGYRAHGVVNGLTAPIVPSTIDQQQGSVSPDAWMRPIAPISKQKG
jgi:hypothetical protein